MNKKRMVLIFAVMLIGIICLFTGCKSKEVKNAETSINEIGTVTIDSRKSIELAERAVAKVPDEDQSKIDNLDVLKQARNDYAELSYERIRTGEKVMVDTALKMIGNYTGENQDIISIKRDLETMKSWGGQWYQKSTYYTKIDFYIENNDYCFSIDYQGYAGTINDGKVIDNDISKAQGIAYSGDLGGQTFLIKFGSDSMNISWADGRISHDLARQ